MLHVILLALSVLWVAACFVLWSQKQPAPILFLESLVMAALAFPALYWYVTRSPVKRDAVRKARLTRP
jgi:uncharacterized membrane protein